MEFNLHVIKLQIENLRTILYELICTNGLTTIEVITCSQKLDKLLLEYEKAKERFNTKNITDNVSHSINTNIYQIA